MLKADLHVHSQYSMDCDTPLEKIISRCKEVGIGCIAIADHGTAEGGLKLQKLAPFKVIVAEEVLTPHGEIMGMFLKETIPSGITAEAAIARIHEQGGLVCIPHPFDTFRQSALTNTLLDGLIEQIDVIEIFNARTLLKRYSTKAQVFARKYGIPGSAGSDAHTPQEIGNAFVEMPDFQNNDEFLQALKKGRVLGHKTSPLIHVSSALTRVKKRL